MNNSWEMEDLFVSKQREPFIVKFQNSKSGLTKRTIVVFSLLFLLMCCPGSSLCKKGGDAGWDGGGAASDEKEDSTSTAVGDSVEEDPEMEMSEYLDDEVRFVEDDFLYEEERAHYRDQGARVGGGSRFSHQSSVISHQYERCPPLPSHPAVASLCDAMRCQRDDECSRDGSVICCYNGCIYACLPKVNPPIAFDWVEETDLKFSSDHGSPLTEPKLNMGLSPKALFNAEISPETISLPGGCFINSKQYDDLLMFRKFDHVRACSCTKGEVFCEINHQPIDAKG